MEVFPDSTSTLNRLTLSNGVEPNGAGGGILNRGELTLNDCTVLNCQATNGGGIANNKTLTLRRTTMNNNNAPMSDGGGLYLAPVVGCTATLENVVVSNNQASKGGGIAVLPGARLDLTNTEIRQNTAAAEGGGIYTDGTVTFLGGFLTSNRAADGAGMYVSAGTSNVNDVRFGSNDANNWGGGVWAKNGSTTSLTRCTFDANQASVGGPKVAYTGGNPNIVGLTDCTGIVPADREQVQ